MTELALRGHVWLVATVLPLLVRWLPLPRLLALVTPSRWRPYRTVPAETIVAAVERRLRRPRNMKRRACLRRGLMLFHFLRLAGRPAVLHFAVYPPALDPTRLHAHCWVTLGGHAVSEPPREIAAVLWTYDGTDPESVPARGNYQERRQGHEGEGKEGVSQAVSEEAQAPGRRDRGRVRVRDRRRDYRGPLTSEMP